MKHINKVIDFMVKLALAEDVGSGDITTRAIVPAEQKATAIIRAKETGVLAGLDVAREVFRHVDHRIKFTAKARDGKEVKKGTVIAIVSGPARGILTGERVALNFLQHLSGIATLTNKFKSQNSKVKSKVKLLDTRKTLPGLRLLEKYAVKMGGGENHRLGLYDAILIKDNHIKLAGGIAKAIQKGKGQAARGKKIEVEAKTIAEVKKAIELKADRILLDNMNIKRLRQAVKLCKKAKIKTEASGGVNLDNIAAIARTGVDYISIGALTHSAPALDINLKLIG
ncbi:MAG: carboxylating nicotinate-nucleotide diphosphorylase [Candidatus Margulisbacteria bacterium]|nr:carboxylating nicotinate-nucleotide diphosphorylase [Candidatus Margulisiibacteriota bacterium]